MVVFDSIVVDLGRKINKPTSSIKEEEENEGNSVSYNATVSKDWLYFLRPRLYGPRKWISISQYIDWIGQKASCPAKNAFASSLLHTRAQDNWYPHVFVSFTAKWSIHQTSLLNSKTPGTVTRPMRRGGGLNLEISVRSRSDMRRSSRRDECLDTNLNEMQDMKPSQSLLNGLSTNEWIAARMTIPAQTKPVNQAYVWGSIYLWTPELLNLLSCHNLILRSAAWCYTAAEFLEPFLWNLRNFICFAYETRWQFVRFTEQHMQKIDKNVHCSC